MIVTFIFAGGLLLVWMQQGCDKIQIDHLLVQPAHQFMEQILRLVEKKDIPSFKNALQDFTDKDKQFSIQIISAVKSYN